MKIFIKSFIFIKIFASNLKWTINLLIILINFRHIFVVIRLYVEIIGKYSLEDHKYCLKDSSVFCLHSTRRSVADNSPKPHQTSDNRCCHPGTDTHLQDKRCPRQRCWTSRCVSKAGLWFDRKSPLCRYTLNHLDNSAVHRHNTRLSVMCL